MQQRLFNRPFKEYLISFSLFFSFILYHSMRNKKKEGLTMEYIVIIPALNPEPCLEKLVDRLWELENQVLIVDDGSGKEYRERFQKLEKKCIVLHHKENKGKGEAIKTALQYIRSKLWEYGAIAKRTS